MSDFGRQMVPHAARRQIFIWAVTLTAIVFCIHLLKIVATGGIGGAIMLLVPFVVVAWTLFARQQWWTILPVACSFGGMLYFGFRIYTHELGLVLAVLALIPLLATPGTHTGSRPPLWMAVYLLIAYLGIHLAFSEYFCFQDRAGGAGNILRVYMHGLWAPIFAIIFIRFGSVTRIKHILVAMYLAALYRVILGFVGYYLPHAFLYIPIINYIPSGMVGAGVDLRASVLLLASLALCHASLARSRVVAGLQMAVLLPSGYLLMLGGGRVSLAVFCGTIALWALIQRRFVFLGAVAVALLLAVGILNRDPSVIYKTDPRVQRVLSILIVRSSTTEAHRIVEGSNQWHRDITRLGRTRWLTSPVTFLVGNRVHRYDEVFFRTWIDQAFRVELAAKQGYYEAGLWTVLAVIGAIGAVLYICIFYSLLRGVVPSLIANGIRYPADAFSFLAVSGTLMWLLFCWIYGHFPSQELLWAVIAKAACDDRHNQNKINTATVQSTAITKGAD